MRVKFNHSSYLTTSALVFFIILINAASLSASDLSDATEMRQKCEGEYKALEITVKNFGNSFVKRRYQDAGELIKEGKVSLAQSKYKEAIEIYKKYMSLNTEIYKDLATDYISRAAMIYNDTAKELVDFYDNEKVAQYFWLANHNVADAKKAAANGNYKLAIDTCRNSKKYSIESYKASGKPVPDKYKKDVKDNNKELFQE